MFFEIYTKWLEYIKTTVISLQMKHNVEKVLQKKDQIEVQNHQISVSGYLKKTVQILQAHIYGAHLVTKIQLDY